MRHFPFLLQMGAGNVKLKVCGGFYAPSADDEKEYIEL